MNINYYYEYNSICIVKIILCNNIVLNDISSLYLSTIYRRFVQNKRIIIIIKYVRLKKIKILFRSK